MRVLLEQNQEPHATLLPRSSPTRPDAIAGKSAAAERVGMPNIAAAPKSCFARKILILIRGLFNRCLANVANHLQKKF